MIPKTIHYCWFGKNDMPESNKKYIAEWRKLHPKWKIKKWDETNSPMNLPYMKNALKNNAWANMSNFLRLHALKKYGGIYLDTDMKIIKSLEPFLVNKCFFGFEEGAEDSESFFVNNAIVGAVKNHKFINECYKNLLKTFDGTEASNESSPRLTTKLLKDLRGLQRYGYQKLDDVVLYPTNVFYPINYEEAYKIRSLNLDEYVDSYAIHTWGRSWFSQEFMLELIDQKQENIANQKKELEEIFKELHGKNEKLKNISERNIFLENVFLQKEETTKVFEKFYYNVKEEIGLTNTLFEGINQSQKEISSQIQELETSLKIQTESNGELLNEIKNKDIKIQKLEDYIKQLDVAVKDMYKSLTIQLETHKNLFRENQEKNNEISLLEKRVFDLQEQNKTFDSSLAIQNSTNEILLQENKKLDINIAEFKRQNFELTKSLILQVTNYTNMVEDKKEKEKELKAKISYFEKEAERTNMAIEKQASNMKALEESNNDLSFQLSEKNKIISAKEVVELELRNRIEAQKMEYESYKKVQDQKKILEGLQNEYNKKLSDIKWYRETYENRNLLGIIKDRVLKFRL